MEIIAGSVINIIFQNQDNSFVVFKIEQSKETGSTTVVGNMPAPLVGEELSLEGEWIEHGRFGLQFKASSCKRMAPSTIKGIERFLASGAITGIGPSMAARLVAHFGARALEIIEYYPHRLTEVAGIGAKKAEAIRLSFAERSELRELMLFLETNGVTSAYAGKIFARYGSNSISVLKEHPYRLAEEVDGIGFRTSDRIATALGFAVNDPGRIAAGIDFALLQISQNGHCCVPEEVLVQETAKLLAAESLEVAVCLSELIKKGQLFVEDYHGLNLVYPRYLYNAEISVAARLKQLQSKALAVQCRDYDSLVSDWENSTGMNLAKAQRQALVAALTHGVLVMTGGPGTGKTVTVKGILGVLARQGFKILLGAPTGRAAKRLSEACGREASTIHRMLESTGGLDGAPQFLRNEDLPLEADVIIIDEASMIDISLMYYLLRAVPEGCRIILVGDVDQLPAVGPGSVLKDIIRSGTIPVIRLTEVFRQAEESIIVLNAHRINRGLLPDMQSSDDFQFREINDSDLVAKNIVGLCLSELPAAGFDALNDIQVLSPMHRHNCGVENLNRLLQAALNPHGNRQNETGGYQPLGAGDKVMQIRNNYTKGVFNGDIGFVVSAEPSKIIVSFPESNVTYEKNEFDQLTLAYAMSVHKSQGSEYGIVIMPLVASHHVMLQRNLLYTAITRAKTKVILLGSKAALNTALANDRTKRRYSLLAERLREESMC